MIDPYFTHAVVRFQNGGTIFPRRTNFLSKITPVVVETGKPISENSMPYSPPVSSYGHCGGLDQPILGWVAGSDAR